MEILIMPTIEYLRDLRGYDEFDEENGDALLYEQGYEGVTEVIENGESFEIPTNHIGRIMDEKEYYFLVEIMDNVYDKELANDSELIEGEYMLEGDIIKTIE